MAKARKKTTQNKSTKIVGKAYLTGKTRSGKGKVTLFTNGKIVTKKSTTAYRTSQGKRRILEVVTTRRVIK